MTGNETENLDPGGQDVENVEEPKDEGGVTDSNHQQSSSSDVVVNEETSSYKNDQGQEEQEQEMIELEQDVYSLIFISRLGSLPFIIGMFVFAFQGWILSLIITDLLEDEDLFAKYNKAKAPVLANDKTVVMAQYTAIIIALISQDDCIRSIGLMVGAKYDTTILEAHTSATKIMWFVSNALRLSEGLLTVVVSFIYIAQSDNILDMFMNFAAVEFISRVDNLVFELAKDGYLGQQARDACAQVQTIQFSPLHRRTPWIRQSVFLAILVAMIVGLTVVQLRQASGLYLYDSSCISMNIVIGEATLDLEKPLFLDGTKRNQTLFVPGIQGSSPPALIYSFFSGDYKVKLEGESSLPVIQVIGKRPVYFEFGGNYDLDDPTAGMFYYCEEDKAWVFTIPAMKHNIPKTKCEHGWLMQSPMTEATSLEDAPTEGWIVWTGTIETTSLQISCKECFRDADCGLTRGKCNKKDRGCECNPGFDGANCEIDLPICPSLAMVGLGQSSDEYSLYGPFGVYFGAYNRPLYGIRDGTEVTHTIFYSGSRWLLASWDSWRLFPLLDSGERIHSYWHLNLTQNLTLFSNPIDSFYPFGENFKWNAIFHSRSAGGGGSYGDSVATDWTNVCEGGNESLVPRNYCGLFGKYNETLGYCDCIMAYGGEHCQFHPAYSYVNFQASSFVAAIQAGATYDNFTYVDTNGTILYEINQYHYRFWRKYTDDDLYGILVKALSVEDEL